MSTKTEQPAKSMPLLLELADLADVVGVSLVTAKNWTNGRTLFIKPSVQQASGRGSRNIYGIQDAYTLAYALRLHDRGLAMATIRDFFEEFNAPEAESIKALVSDPRFIWLVVVFDPQGCLIEALEESDLESRPKVLELTEVAEDIFQHAVNVRALRARVDERMEKFLK